MSDLSAQERLERIRRKEAELAARESNLRKENIEFDDSKPPNFPPFCPFVYHDISEINSLAMPTVKLAFILQILFATAMLLNAFACIGVTSMNSTSPGSVQYSSGSYIVFGIIYLLFGVPVAFKIVYMKFYEQCKVGDVSMGWMGLQIIFVAVNIYAAAGSVNSGFVGLITMLDLIYKSESGLAKLFAIASAILFVLSALGQFYLLTKAMELYKNQGQKTNTA